VTGFFKFAPGSSFSFALLGFARVALPVRQVTGELCRCETQVSIMRQQHGLYEINSRQHPLAEHLASGRRVGLSEPERTLLMFALSGRALSTTESKYCVSSFGAFRGLCSNTCFALCSGHLSESEVDIRSHESTMELNKYFCVILKHMACHLYIW
jgi:hypothetical protein